MNFNDDLFRRLRRLLSLNRRGLGKGSLESFCRTYLGHYFSLPFSPMHQDMMALLEEISRKRRRSRVAIAAPRSYAKSTIATLAYTLWSICYEREKCIVIASNTVEQAIRQFGDIRTELETNQRLLRDFRDVTIEPGKDSFPEPWRRDAIRTKNGVLVCAVGTDTSFRGLRNREHRPSLVILDDIEREDQVRSEEQRRRIRDWLMTDVLKLGSPDMNAVVVGTILRRDSVLGELLDAGLFPGWITRRFKAIVRDSNHPELWQTWEAIYRGAENFSAQTGPDAARAYFEAHREPMLDGAKILWPERETLYDLMEGRLREGEKSFLSEKQNEPHDTDVCPFKEERFQYWENEYPSLEALIASSRGRGYFVAACDPSLGKAGRASDPSAIVSLYFNPLTAVFFVVDALIEKRTTHEIVEDILELHRIRNFKKFGFEANGFQVTLSDALQTESIKRGIHLPVKPIENLFDKKGRIESIEPLVNTGKIKFKRSHATLLHQLRGFPFAEHDDGPDALEMAIRMVGKNVPPEPPPESQGRGPKRQPPHDPYNWRWLIDDYPDADDITGIIY